MSAGLRLQTDSAQPFSLLLLAVTYRLICSHGINFLMLLGLIIQVKVKLCFLKIPGWPLKKGLPPFSASV